MRGSTATRGSTPVHRLPGNAHLSFPGCEGDSLLMLLDARGVHCSTGSACSAGVAEPSHVLLAMGSSPAEARSSLAVLARAHLDAGRRRRAGRRHRARRRAGPGRPRVDRHAGLTVRDRMRVLAALSGGVDSAVAAARARDAGHDVTAVHLALSSNPQTFRSGARGCCSLEDSRDARRVADVLGLPYYVWDFAEQFRAEVVDDFLSPSTRRDARPTRACAATSGSSSPRCSTVPSGWASTPCAPVTTRRSSRVPMAQSCIVRSIRTRTSRTCWQCSTATRSARSMFPLGDSLKARRAPGGQPLADCWSPTSRTATTSASSPTVTPRGSLPSHLGERPGHVLDSEGAVLGDHDGAYAFTVGQRQGLWALTVATPDRSPATCSRSSRPPTRSLWGRGRRLRCDEIVAERPRWCGPPVADGRRVAVQYRAHGETVTATRAR